jgi:hypothetical protein
MNARDVSPLHLTFNALGCAAVAAVSLTVAFTPAFTLTSIVPPRPNDPDGSKALGFVIAGVLLGALFGVAGLIDLLRTVKKLRSIPSDAHAEEWTAEGPR